MSYQFYKVMHIIGLVFLFMGLGSVLVLSYTGQMKNKKAKMIGFICHGIGLVIMIVAGFGLAARLQMFGNLPGWIYAKLVIWVLLGLAISVLKRKPQWAYASMLVMVALGGAASYLAVNKPF